MATLNDIQELRPGLLDKAGDIVFRRAGTETLARLCLRSPIADSEVLYSHAITLIAAGALRAATNCAFYA